MIKYFYVKKRYFKQKLDTSNFKNKKIFSIQRKWTYVFHTDTTKKIYIELKWKNVNSKQI